MRPHCWAPAGPGKSLSHPRPSCLLLSIRTPLEPESLAGPPQLPPALERSSFHTDSVPVCEGGQRLPPCPPHLGSLEPSLSCPYPSFSSQWHSPLPHPGGGLAEVPPIRPGSVLEATAQAPSQPKEGSPYSGMPSPFMEMSKCSLVSRSFGSHLAGTTEK